MCFACLFIIKLFNFRYLAEVATGDDRSSVLEDSQKAYQVCSDEHASGAVASSLFSPPPPM